MRTLLWGLVVGTFFGVGIGLAPVVVVAVFGQGFRDFDGVGGVGRYVLWAINAGVLGGLTAGIARLVVRSGTGLRLASGIVLAEVFGLQPLIFDMGNETSAGSAAVWMAAISFVMGVLFGPIMVRGLERSWPGLHGWGAPEPGSRPRPDTMDQ
jgi:hypothetical protein